MLLQQTINRQLTDSAHLVVIIGAIIFFGFPLSYWIWDEWFPQPYESPAMSIIASLMGLGLLISPYWPEKLKMLLPWYWFSCLVYSLCFFFAYSFLMNHADVTSSSWLLFSVFLLILLVDLQTLCTILGIGFVLAFSLYYFTSPSVHFSGEHIELTLILCFVLICSTLLNYKTKLVSQQRTAGIAAAAGMIAHELRTPLLGIKSGAQAISAAMPTLFEAYEIAKHRQLLSAPFRENRFKQLEKVNDRIVHEVDYANTMIDMLLIKAGHEKALERCVLENFSMRECLQEAIARYPFQSVKAKELITYEGDFEFIGSMLLMQHVLFNLLKNAFHAIATAQKGEVTIWTSEDANNHFLHIKDTAKGIPKEQQTFLFENFYTTTFMGTGLGLYFCKMVMKKFQGDITCESQEHFYTQFNLKFPKIQ